MFRKLLALLFPPPPPADTTFSDEVARRCMALRESSAQTKASTAELRAAGEQFKRSLARRTA